LVDEAWTDRDLIAAGWREADLDWERHTLEALADLGEGREQEALDGIRKALYVARTHFAKGDPRLAASLTNQAAALAAADPPAATGVIVKAALEAWGDCEGAIAGMNPPRRARSSLFHLRMEQRHRETYSERWRDESQQRLADVRAGFAEAEALMLVGRAEARERIALWQRERPPALDDSRKLLAAVILLAARGPRANASVSPGTRETGGHASDRRDETKPASF
jgi:hypothetical protein